MSDEQVFLTVIYTVGFLAFLAMGPRSADVHTRLGWWAWLIGCVFLWPLALALLAVFMIGDIVVRTVRKGWGKP